MVDQIQRIVWGDRLEKLANALGSHYLPFPD